MKMVIISLSGILFLIVALLVYAAMKPDVYPIERSILVCADAEKIFNRINNLRAWDTWTPYDQNDQTQLSFSGPESGPTAKFAWDSKGKAGKGSMEIISSTFPTHVSIDLRMIKPFQVINRVDFLIQPDACGSKVTWRMQHHEPYPAKVVGIFMSMDKMVGKDFEVGLERLKSVVEGEN